MDRKWALTEGKRHADKWYELHQPLIEARQYVERLHINQEVGNSTNDYQQLFKNTMNGSALKSN
ncbi:hypothetical protein [Enterococcus sp. BWR-S5]|uniref:hypothetical protein n=1 Tax=Enterococcus sp. BWR-S5 TaxID=2787714 RepID=UPI001922C4D5|nr:hypothetical protein [Enterococcus sp. BWR-S5]MBL1226516.1 hypothetical protein [Enterococcus sp. BWR-S5]